jgi:hypothetical protein
MMAEPCIPFLLPLADLRGGHGIAQSERDELHHLALLPMGEHGPVFLDFFRFIEEVHGLLSIRTIRDRKSGAATFTVALIEQGGATFTVALSKACRMRQ